LTVPACRSRRSFDPRSRAGSDDTATRSLTWHRTVSIHAPARGATRALRSSGSTASCFDPRSRAGSDRRSPAWCMRSWCFDPRSRAGSDTMHPSACARHSCFDPRSRAGSDQTVEAVGGLAGVSIHAPARGATPGAGGQQQQMSVSIHAPARGATSTAVQMADRRSGFRSTLPRGERLESSIETRPPSSFDPRSRAGSDAGARATRLVAVGFDPRSRAGSDCRRVERL